MKRNSPIWRKNAGNIQHKMEKVGGGGGGVCWGGGGLGGSTGGNITH